jgi:hypothetical protein
MTGLVPKASLIVACGLLVAAVASAAVPDPAHSTKPAYVVLVGTNSGVADPNGNFTVVVRDVANNPIANSQVIVDFNACSDARICSAAAAGKTVDCPTKTVRGFTDGSGSITFDIVGGGKNTGAAAGPGAGCANITADGVSLVHPTVNIYDENGGVTTQGMEVTDLSAFLKDLGTGFYFGRSDFNQGGSLEVVDLSVFLSRLGTGFSANGCSTTYCP